MPECRRPESSERSKNPHELVEIICVPISPDLLVVLTHSSPKRIGLKRALIPIAQLLKNPPAMQETPVQFLGWTDLLEKE